MKFQCHLMCIDDNNIYENGKYCRPQYDNAALQTWYFKKTDQWFIQNVQQWM